MSTNRNTVYIPTFILGIVITIFSVVFLYQYQNPYQNYSIHKKKSYLKKSFYVLEVLFYSVVGIIISYSIELSFDKRETSGNDTTLSSNILFIIMIAGFLCLFYTLCTTSKFISDHNTKKNTKKTLLFA